MQVPLRITATNIELGPDDEALIQQRVGWLERFYPQLVTCIVTLEGPGEHHRKGGPVAVQLELRIPRSEPLLVNRQVAPDLDMALQEAFDTARRRLEDIGRRQRLQVKIHLPRLEGRVAQLLPDADCGSSPPTTDTASTSTATPSCHQATPSSPSAATCGSSRSRGRRDRRQAPSRCCED